MLNSRIGWVVYTAFLPEIPQNGLPLGYETVLVGDRYYTYLRLATKARPSFLDQLFSGKVYQIEPKKSWDKISVDLYYKLEGEFTEGENYWSGGSLPLKDSILTLRDKLVNKDTEAQVVAKLEKLICTRETPWDWTNIADRARLLSEQIPAHLKHRRTRIVKEVDSHYQGFLALHMKEAEDRFCIVINGNSGTQKTKLSKLIVKRLAESEVVVSPHSYAMWEEQDLTDKLERLDGKEVVILDDYSGENHKLGVLNKLTSDSQVSSIRVMGDYQTTRYVKGVILPTTDSIETWITHKTGTIRKFVQILRRTNCSLYIFKAKHVKHPTWEDFGDGRVFYTGNVREWIYRTLMTACPELVDEPLWANRRDTQLAKDLAKLFHQVVTTLYADKTYWGGSFDRKHVPKQFWSHQLETTLWAKPGIIQMFSLPSYEWLRDQIKLLDSPELRLPHKIPTELIEKEEATMNESDTPKLKKDSYALDIETEAFVDSPLKKLELKSIQVDDLFVKVTPENKPYLQKQLIGREFIVFNSPFEQTQLYRNGFDIWSNDWKDVLLLAKLYDNRLAEEGVQSLEAMEEHFLQTTRKKDLVAQLSQKYKVTKKKDFFKHPNIVDDPLFQEYGINDTKITQELYDHLKDRVDPKLFKWLQKLQDKLAQWQMEGIPFPRDRIRAAKDRLRLNTQNSLDKVVDIRIGHKTKALLNGWTSSKLLTAYIENYKKEWLPYLRPTESGKSLCFNRDAIEPLMDNFPSDSALQAVYSIKRKKTAIQQYTKLLVYSDKDRFYPNYFMLSCASGRFTSEKKS